MFAVQTSKLVLCFLLHAAFMPFISCQQITQSGEPVNQFQWAFGVARDSNLNSRTFTTLSFPLDVANAGGMYQQGADYFVAPSSGLYFLYICVGVKPKSTVNVQQNGGYPPISFTWQSTSNTDITLGCRGGITRLAQGMNVGFIAEGGGIYSDNLRQTSFSAFSISDAMTSAEHSLFVSYFSGSPFNTLAPIPLGRANTLYVNPSDSLFNSATYSYKCPTDGYYLVSFSVGMRSGQYAYVALTDFDTVNFELTSTSQAKNGLTTVSRSVLVNCTAATDLQVVLVDGEIFSGTSKASNLVSLTVVPYTPTGQSVAWALYMGSYWSVTNTTETLIFDQTEIIDGVTYDAEGTLTVSQSGLYMVYLSAASLPQLPVDLVVMHNDSAIFGIKTSVVGSDGVEMMEHGVIVELESGDKLEVVGSSGSSIYSDNGKQVAFWGFLVHEA